MVGARSQMGSSLHAKVKTEGLNTKSRDELDQAAQIVSRSRKMIKEFLMVWEELLA